MAITPVQPNIDNKNSVSYREQKNAIKTSENIKPLKPEGHLVHDTITSVPKFWIKDIAYDLKAIRDGFKGTSNDHQQGRLNDVGLKLGGIGIATYLASMTSDPKLRLMEYLGLGSFLAAMSLYPKIAINAPSRIVHGFDIGKEYIDDQGRKKSVFQDSNYIPFDMYQGDYPGEDLDIIGDRMGIPRDIKNRHDLIKEQMRKIATQNNTLWMLTAGFATPIMAALMCVGLEKLIVPAMEAMRNYKANSNINHALNISKEMALDAAEINPCDLSVKVKHILNKYENKALPKEEFDKIVKLLTDKTESDISAGIKEDLAKLLKSEPKFNANADFIAATIKENIPAANRNELEKIFLPTVEEIEAIVGNIVSDRKELTEEQIRTLKKEFRNHFAKKGVGTDPYYKAIETDLVNKISVSLKSKPINYINEWQISQAVDFAKIIGDFKAKEKLVDSAALAKFEESPQTMLARAYEKFENTLFEVLDIKFKDIKQMKESDKFAREIMEAKLDALSKNESKYKKAIEKLSKVMSDMEVSLHGKFEEKSNILDLVNAMENVYNNTARRLQNLDGNIFSKTINMLIKEDASTDIPNRITSRKELFKLFNGTLEPDKKLADNSLKYALENSKGVGSAKINAINRMVDRYQGVKNSFNRILLAMDLFKRGIPEGKYEGEVAKISREYLLHGSSSQFTQKFGLINNPELYRDVMFNTFDEGKLLDATTNSFVETDIKTGNVLDGFKKYMKRVKEVIGNNDIDFTKPRHITGGEDINRIYSQDALTRLSKFNLIAQDPVTMVKKAAGRKYGSALWLRKAAAIGAAVLSVAVAAQFTFGKIKNPQNIKKQVSDDTNN